MQAESNQYAGNDNYGKPKSDYIKKVAAMSDEELFKETKSKVWLSAFANNNPRSDYHWHVGGIYDEWARREKIEEYKRAYDETYRETTGQGR